MLSPVFVISLFLYTIILILNMHYKVRDLSGTIHLSLCRRDEIYVHSIFSKPITHRMCCISRMIMGNVKNNEVKLLFYQPNNKQVTAPPYFHE